MTIFQVLPVSGAFTGAFQGDGSELYGVVSVSHVIKTDTASYAAGGGSASYVDTASYAESGDGAFGGAFTGTFVGDGSGLLGVVSASHSVQTDTASYVDEFAGQVSASQIIPSGNFGDSLHFEGDVTIDGWLNAGSFVIVSGNVTSSIIEDSGSTIFGDSLDDTQRFTGSWYSTGSFDLDGIFSASEFYGDGAGLTGVVSASHSVVADSASYIESASIAVTASYAESASRIDSASYADKADVAPLEVHFNNNFGRGVVINTLPAALTEHDQGERTIADLTGYTQARVSVRINEEDSSGDVAIQYSTDEFSWAYLDGSSGPVATMAATGTIVSSWVDITALAQADVFLRWVTVNGSASGKCNIGTIVLSAR